MTIGAGILVILGLVLIATLPAWPHSRRWGYGPSAFVGLVTAIVLVLYEMGRL